MHAVSSHVHRRRRGAGPGLRRPAAGRCAARECRCGCDRRPPPARSHRRWRPQAKRGRSTGPRCHRRNDHRSAVRTACPAPSTSGSWSGTAFPACPGRPSGLHNGSPPRRRASLHQRGCRPPPRPGFRTRAHCLRTRGSIRPRPQSSPRSRRRRGCRAAQPAHLPANRHAPAHGCSLRHGQHPATASAWPG
ncbi:hypothetical protein D3C71_1483970 [compost metagenome]